MCTPLTLLRVTALIVLIGLPELASALITPTSQVRRVSCSASGGDIEGIEFDEASDSRDASNFDSFNVGVGETVLPSEASGSGTGIQDSSIGVSIITATGSASANAEAYDFEWWADAAGSSEFDVTFQIETRVDYSLAGMVAAFDNGSAHVELREVGGAVVFFAEGVEETPFSQQGTLEPGSYRLVATASGSCYAEAFEFDYAFGEYDVSLQVIGATVSPAARAFSMTVSPNPMSSRTSIAFSSERPTPAQIEVFDARGRSVRGFSLGRVPAGLVVWDGRTESGDRVARGIYYVQLRTGDQVHSRKLTLLR